MLANRCFFRCQYNEVIHDEMQGLCLLKNQFQSSGLYSILPARTQQMYSLFLFDGLKSLIFHFYVFNYREDQIESSLPNHCRVIDIWRQYFLSPSFSYCKVKPLFWNDEWFVVFNWTRYKIISIKYSDYKLFTHLYIRIHKYFLQSYWF